ncbi:hypothetical protein [Roseateles violae]|uniref:Uncharacterized protein n=1 Tax=Roseateles violae TaxID=3058042 RepID=A0ABT8E016_9BURK|nr:hypothetical protein [Pelomonas sp. PFR6]MDN3923211.1 hypothetical protein [Pelomonas sp. PFR6]
MEDTSLTTRQAYLAMYAFLSRQYELGCEELGGLLGSMSLLADGQTVDPAVGQDWAEAVASAKSGTVDAYLKLQGRESS